MAKKIKSYHLPKLNKQTENIDSALRLLGLEGIRLFFDTISKQTLNKKDITPYDFLENLLEKELAWREDNRLIRWAQAARFPWKKTLQDFDFSAQPSIDQTQVYDLSSCRYIDNSQNIVFFGVPGVGKTHLAISLGLEAINQGYEARFLTLGQLIDMIEKSYAGEGTHRLFSSLLRPDLLILDEMDLFETKGSISDFLFKLCQQRYEKKSTIFTSNRSFDSWDKVFGNETRAGSIVDRIMHNGVIINIKGGSYRTRNRNSIQAIL